MSKVVTIVGLYFEELLVRRQPYEGFVPEVPLEGEVWTMNHYYEFYPWLRPSRIIQIHTDYSELPQAAESYEAYEKSGAKVFVRQKRLKGLSPACQRIYPESVIQDWPRGYFAGAAHYALALAFHEGYEEIHLRGIRLLDPGEYDCQLPSLMYGIERCETAGIKVHSRYMSWWKRRVEALNPKVVARHYGCDDETVKEIVSWRDVVEQVRIEYGTKQSRKRILRAIERAVQSARRANIG